MKKPLLLLDNSWLESKGGRHFVVIGRWFGKDTEEIELLEYLSTKSFRWPAADLKKLIDEGLIKKIT
jgi:hypothetical protein